jgi:hypothetical protein
VHHCRQFATNCYVLEMLQRPIDNENDNNDGDNDFVDVVG